MTINLQQHPLHQNNQILALALDLNRVVTTPQQQRQSPKARKHFPKEPSASTSSTKSPNAKFEPPQGKKDQKIES